MYMCSSIDCASKYDYVYENYVHSVYQPRTQALYFTIIPRLWKDPGSGWSPVFQVLGDNNWNLPGVDRAKSFLIKICQND